VEVNECSEKPSFGSASSWFYVVFVVSGPERDRQTIHAHMAKMKLKEINSATSEYAKHFGGLFPESLDALGPPAKNQKADCRSAGLVHKPFATNSGGYIFKYRIGLPSRTAPGRLPRRDALQFFGATGCVREDPTHQSLHR
jgi:hypothetical protein